MSPDHAWMVAGWIVSRLVDKARARIDPASEIDYRLQVGIANNLIALDLIEPVLAREMRDLLAVTARDEIADLDTKGGSERDAMYCQALRELLAMFDAAESV